MSTSADKTRASTQLRSNAEVRLRAGIPPETQGWTVGAAALSLLHSLASNPATAGDALKLLHELQVHQVELDLQHEHMEEDRRQLQQIADHYAHLYAFAPVAHFSVDDSGHIIEGNIAATRMLGAERDGLEGHAIDRLVAPGSGPLLRALLARARSFSLPNSCRMQAADGSGWLEVAAITSPRGNYCLVVATCVSDASMPSGTG